MAICSWPWFRGGLWPSLRPADPLTPSVTNAWCILRDFQDRRYNSKLGQVNGQSDASRAGVGAVSLHISGGVSSFEAKQGRWVSTAHQHGDLRLRTSLATSNCCWWHTTRRRILPERGSALLTTHAGRVGLNHALQALQNVCKGGPLQLFRGAASAWVEIPRPPFSRGFRGGG